MLAEILRRADPDRYFSMLFAPAERRTALCALYAFNHELARACEVAREPAMAFIRLQWWREVVQGAARNHQVATPLQAALATGALHAPDLLAMIAAREAEAGFEIEALEDWRAWLLAGPGSLATAAGRVLGAGDVERLRPLGAGYGAAGLLISLAAHAAQGRCLVPGAMLRAHGLTAAALLADPYAGALAPVRAALATQVHDLAGRAQRWPRAWIAAALPAILARRRARAPYHTSLLGDRLAVLRAYVTGVA